MPRPQDWSAICLVVAFNLADNLPEAATKQTCLRRYGFLAPAAIGTCCPSQVSQAEQLLILKVFSLEDYSAHSNYTELALRELGEYDVFPHVGRRTQINLPGARQPVFPIITGTFGGVDFLHSVMGEFSDKATQSEISELEGTMQSSSQSDTSLLQDLLNQVPSGLFGGKDEAGKVDELQANATAAQMQNTHISPRQPEAWTRQLDQIQKEIYPIIEWHDEMMQSITEAIEKIPVLPALIEQIEGVYHPPAFCIKHADQK